MSTVPPIPPYDARKLSRITFRADLGRGFCFGFAEACWESLFLLIAIRVFQGGGTGIEGLGDAETKTLKSILLAGGFLGLLLSPISLNVASRLGLPVSWIASGYLFISGTIAASALFAESLEVFVACAALSQLFATSSAPLRTQIYSNNYQRHERGTRVATTLMLAAAVSSLFALGGGALLDLDLDYYRVIIGLMALSTFGGVFFTARIPSRPLQRRDAGNIFQNLGLLRSDATFGIMIAAWFLMGLGNLMMRGLKTEYLVQPAYGIVANNSTVSLLTWTLPVIFRLLSIQFWGLLFDRIAFLYMRILISTCFLVGILIYFNNTNVWLIGVGAAVMGLGAGGGNIAWNLWVTKLAPPERTGAYMSIHTGFTGLRGTMAPFLGYYLLDTIDPTGAAWTAAGLILASIVIFWGIRRDPRIR
ncbi:MAG: MFS transporter [Opitutales bacterium]